MNRRDFIGLTVTTFTQAVWAKDRRQKNALIPSSQPASVRPNFIIILCDNLGYGDLGCFGSNTHRTPHIDRLAGEGMRLSSFYSSSPVCTPSRASLMTGCYAQRVDMHISDKGGWVLRPVSAKGLNISEVTIAEILKEQGYATACLGKWHLGDQPEFLPTHHGFDYYFGIPYSEDMVPSHTLSWPPLPLLRNETVVEAPVDLAKMTRRYVQEAMVFIRKNRDKPFFLYFAHHLPGSRKIPVVDPKFKGKSRNSRYGDSVEEIDWSVGQIMSELKRLGIDDQTLVVLTSDNGTPPGKGGSNAPWGGWAYSTSEGGMRMPCIVRWPKKVPADRTCGELCTMMDLLPTFTGLAGTAVYRDRIIDGKDIWPLWSGRPGAKSPHKMFYYYMINQLQAVRSGKWKLHLPLKKIRGKVVNRPLKLIDLSKDPKETNNLSQDYPKVVRRLMALAKQARLDLGDLDNPGAGQRPAGYVDCPTPRVM
ncbi:MAG: sulfatase family protein [Planctomycetota bacterium]|jgi:arylsulfatase A-like enzyme